MNDLSINGLNRVVDCLLTKAQHIDDMIRWLTSLKIECDLPGIDHQDIDLKIEENRLHIGLKSSIVQHAGQRLELIGNSAQIRTIAGLVRELADGTENVVLEGETGVGKHFLATFIHSLSKRNDKPFIRVQAADLVRQSEVKKYLKQAAAGTLFIGNLEDFDLAGQGEFWQQLVTDGGDQKSRIISSTNRDLGQQVEKGLFRSDLKEQLAQCYISIPPLQKRKTDIPLLARHFIPLICARSAKPLKQMSHEYLAQLEMYHWPGNIRELINTLEQSIYSAGEKPTLFSKDLPIKIRLATRGQLAEQKRGL